MATATPIAVTRLTTDTVIEATSTMFDVSKVFGRFFFGVDDSLGIFAGSYSTSGSFSCFSERFVLSCVLVSCAWCVPLALLHFSRKADGNATHY